MLFPQIGHNKYILHRKWVCALFKVAHFECTSKHATFSLKSLSPRDIRRQSADLRCSGSKRVAPYVASISRHLINLSKTPYVCNSEKQSIFHFQSRQSLRRQWSNYNNVFNASSCSQEHLSCAVFDETGIMTNMTKAIYLPASATHSARSAAYSSREKMHEISTSTFPLILNIPPLHTAFSTPILWLERLIRQFISAV